MSPPQASSPQVAAGDELDLGALRHKKSPVPRQPQHAVIHPDIRASPLSAFWSTAHCITG